MRRLLVRSDLQRQQQRGVSAAAVHVDVPAVSNSQRDVCCDTQELGSSSQSFSRQHSEQPRQLDISHVCGRLSCRLAALSAHLRGGCQRHRPVLGCRTDTAEFAALAGCVVCGVRAAACVQW